MKKTKYYYNAKFSGEVIKKAYDLFKIKSNVKIDRFSELLLGFEDEAWEYDSFDEFLADYPKAKYFSFDRIEQKNRFTISGSGNNTNSLRITFSNRKDIESIFQVFEANLESSKITISSMPIKIFIGHGNNDQWRDLKDHLHEQHGFDVVAYEVGPRAGLSVKEVLESMLNDSSYAILVLTGEDMDAYGQMHARENVIHELGLFQGRLGFRKAIVLLENNVTEFSNICGINQTRFSKGNIRETFGDVLATINREFSQKDD